VPPFLYDGPVTRQDLADYYHEVSRTDFYAGAIREELERQGVAENTYFVYISDNGRPFPRCKTRLYDSGIKTPLIVWAPGRVKAGRANGLVSTIDLAPTFLELSGLTPPESVQGVSMRPLLEDPKATTRDYVFAEHNWHVFQAHERMARWHKWLYIRNAWPERQNLCVESTPHFPAGQELWQAEVDGKLKPEQRDVFQKPRAAEELYDVEADPYQVTNLAGVAEHQQTLLHLRGVLDQWTKETGDTVPENPTNDREDIDRNKYPDHKRGTFPGAEVDAAHINRPGPVQAKAGM
jgi:arylsulfatase